MKRLALMARRRRLFSTGMRNMFATYLERRSPGLVVLAYGTNEAVSGGWNSEKYQANVFEGVAANSPSGSRCIYFDSWAAGFVVKP